MTTNAERLAQEISFFSKLVKCKTPAKEHVYASRAPPQLGSESDEKIYKSKLRKHLTHNKLNSRMWQNKFSFYFDIPIIVYNETAYGNAMTLKLCCLFLIYFFIKFSKQKRFVVITNDNKNIR